VKRIRVRLTYANVMSTIAVFLLIGGGAAFAASQLPKNSVGSKQLKKNSVNSAKVHDNSLGLADFKASEREKLKGPQGIQGPAGAPGATKVVARRAEQTGIANNTLSTESVNCAAGETLVGGGAAFVTVGNAYDFPAVLHGSVPLGADGKPVQDGATPVGWRASAKNETGSTRNFVVIALCASP
jgi:hypothetical protein